jgi:hypothetical protein
MKPIFKLKCVTRILDQSKGMDFLQITYVCDSSELGHEFELKFISPNTGKDIIYQGSFEFLNNLYSI